MKNINDIADYIITKIKIEDDRPSLINLKLQKLLYYVQAWSYGINKKPLFDGEFQAWIHGPVNQIIFDRFKETKYIYSEIEMTDVMNHDILDHHDDDYAFVDYILDSYAQFSGSELEQMTHLEDPWINARVGYKSNERCEKLISPESMTEYYGKRYDEISKSEDTSQA